jgi:ATP-binding protein involved in chromosome partitioning
MRYAVPLNNGLLSMHFGHCEEFAFIDVDVESQEVADAVIAQPPPHEPGALPAWLRQNGTNIVIAGGMGSRAHGLFEEAGIRVIVGAPVAPPSELVTAHLAGTLETGGNVCDH